MTIIRFQPQRYNVKLDGVSDAKLELQLACYDTAAAYAASAYRVFTRDGEAPQVSANWTNEPIFTWFRGQRYYTFSSAYDTTGTRTYASDLSLPVSASTASVSISFTGLQEGTGVSDVAYLWNLTATKSGTVRQLVAGRIDMDPARPYDASGSVNIVSAATAHKCF